MMHIEVLEKYHEGQSQIPFTQSELYARWQKESGNAMVHTVFKKNGVVVGSAQWKRISLRGVVVLYAPHGPLWSNGFEYANEDENAFVLFARQYGATVVCMDHVPFLESASFLRTKKIPVRSVYSYMQPRNEWCIDLTQKIETILSGRKTRVRRVLRHVDEYDIVEKRKEKNIQDFLTCMKETATTKSFLLHPESYYRTLLNVLREDEGCLLTVYHKKVCCAAGIFIFNRSECVFLFGGSKKDGGSVAPYILHSYMMQRAMEKGLHSYNFGGVSAYEGDSLKGVTFFKEGWGGATIESARSFEIVISPVRYTVYKILRKIKKLF